MNKWNGELLCIKSRQVGCSQSLTEGTIYRVVDGRFVYDDGWISLLYDSYSDLVAMNVGLKEHLIEHKKGEVNNMEKSDLRAGMIVENRDGELYLLDEKLCGNRVGYYCNVTQSMMNGITGSLDIMKVYTTDSMYNILDDIKKYGSIKLRKEFKLVWERQIVKEMTIEEIQKKLGYKIKIVE